MKNTTTSMMIQKSDFYPSRQIRTLILSTNVNDYDTGEPIIDGSIRKLIIQYSLSSMVSRWEENTVV